MSEEHEKFWNSQRIAFAVLFIVGFVLGAIITNQVIDPVLNQGIINDSNSLSELNQRIEARNDELYNCLVTNSINPETC